MRYYPYTTPQILDEATYVEYGGHTGTASHQQIQAAMTIAEWQMTQHLRTFMLPTTVTGTYNMNERTFPLVLEYGHVNNITLGYLTDSLGTTITGSPHLIDQEGGFVSFDAVSNSKARYYPWPYPNYVGTYYKPPFTLTFVYNAGYGINDSKNHPNLLMALTFAADMILNEIQDAGGTETEIGIESWSSLRYAEKRFPLRQTAFGSSAKAQYISTLVEGLRVKRIGKLR